MTTTIGARNARKGKSLFVPLMITAAVVLVLVVGAVWWSESGHEDEAATGADGSHGAALTEPGQERAEPGQEGADAAGSATVPADAASGEDATQSEAGQPDPAAANDDVAAEPDGDAPAADDTEGAGPEGGQTDPAAGAEPEKAPAAVLEPVN